VQSILILTAVELEARALARALELPRLSSPARAFGRGGVRLGSIGLGASQLGSRWTALLHGLDRPLVVSAGLCGALDPTLRLGAVVVPDAVQGPDGAIDRVSEPDHRAAVARAPWVETGVLVTTREVLATREAKAEALARTGARVVDLESAFVVRAAAAHGLPALVARGVSDGADEGLPPALIRLVTPEGRLRLGRAVALIARPATLPRALALRRASIRALRGVARFLAAITE